MCDGDDLLIIAIGTGVQQALKARDILAAEGIFATVVNARFVKPLDQALLLEKLPHSSGSSQWRSMCWQAGSGQQSWSCLWTMD